MHTLLQPYCHPTNAQNHYGGPVKRRKKQNLRRRRVSIHSYALVNYDRRADKTSLLFLSTCTQDTRGLCYVDCIWSKKKQKKKY